MGVNKDGQGETLKAALTELLLSVEASTGHGMKASVLLLDRKDNCLRTGAAPSLPESYNAGIDGIEIGPAVGSCGTAAYYGEPVFVDDIKADPVWADFVDLALANGLRACWSVPIFDEEGAVIGTFANYYAEQRHPRPEDFHMVTAVAKRAARLILTHAPATEA